ncbi:UvrD-helicase domain-containing protein [Nocardia asiatica]|uniref:UvrD-helicase domain-containing protein n=1 Tax=Nocardia asiatica TaxID=209252 RepID=UPI0024573FDC|nr:UvrD-helicase domain-containing protein [Nocardia asiatica]
MSGYKPTAEQQLIIDAARTGRNLVVQAGAGTGKTSTLKMVSRALADRRALYVAYNRATADEARASFPENVTVKTAHGLAYAAVGGDYRHRLNGPRQPARRAAELLEMKTWLDLDTTKIAPRTLARITIETVGRYCYSADHEIGTQHVPFQRGLDRDQHTAIASYVIPYARKAWADIISRDGRLKFEHDHYLKCQPPGTLVSIARYGSNDFAVKPIEEIQVGDKVVTWGGNRQGKIRRSGRTVTHVGSRDYRGDLITVTTPSGASSSYTHDHICIANVGDAMDGKSIVYLMQRGRDFRIGRVRWRYGSQGNTLGLVARIRMQGADAAWILSSHDSDRDAALAEALAQHEYGIPGWQFRSENEAMPLEQFWAKAGNNYVQAAECLNAHGRSPHYPFWELGDAPLRTRVPMQIRACNLMDGMRVCEVAQVEPDKVGNIFTGGWTRAWQTASVTRSPYDGPVHSIEVDVDHTYIADGIVTHNCWALTNPTLPYDVIMLDEAQDSNPLVANLVQSQQTQTLAVGDSAQQLYGWRGAQDALDTWPADHRLYLSQSWRFGQAVADEANKWLSLLDTPLRLSGNPSLASKLEAVTSPDAILCRTNGRAMAEVMQRLNAGVRVALVGGGGAIKQLALAAQDLKTGRPTYHPELFVFTTWQEVQDYSDEPSGQDLRPFVQLIDEHGPDAVIAATEKLTDERRADVTISTGHKAKGREWDSVLIAKDFTEPELDPETGEYEEITPADIMLAYVSVTRAKLRLDTGGLAWIDKYLMAA